MSASQGQKIELLRHCVATTVPAGDLFTLQAGAIVTVMQALGGSITVRTETGALVRIDGGDADALGLERPGRSVMVVGSGAFNPDQVTEALRTVYDPEIPVNVVELGLVYRCEAVERPDGTRLVEIDMSMTAPGCGMGDVLRADAARVVAKLPGVDDVEVNLVWDPPWTLSRMSDAAKLEVGLL